MRVGVVGLCSQVAVDEDVVVALIHEGLSFAEDEDGDEGQGHEQIFCAELVFEIFEVPDVPEDVEGNSYLIVGDFVGLVFRKDVF